MQSDKLRELLQRLQSGDIDTESALQQIQSSDVADLGFANVDLQRQERCGFPEVVFCEGKTAAWVVDIVQKLFDAKQDCLATRVNDEQSGELQMAFPHAEQDREARTFWMPQPDSERITCGKVMVLTAGTSDLSVAKEAAVTATAMGCEVTLRADVGVAGIHRLFRYRDEIARADAVVVVAGMDGALPSVVGGLVDCPVIAVPTSVGYGAAFGGLAALLTMLNSCSAGVVAVNIDGGFKGGYVAALIAKRAGQRNQ